MLGGRLVLPLLETGQQPSVFALYVLEHVEKDPSRELGVQEGRKGKQVVHVVVSEPFAVGAMDIEPLPGVLQ